MVTIVGYIVDLREIFLALKNWKSHLFTGGGGGVTSLFYTIHKKGKKC